VGVKVVLYLPRPFVAWIPFRLFSGMEKSYRDRIKQRLHEQGCTVLDPWEGPFATAIAETDRKRALRDLSKERSVELRKHLL
jgi:hypothetical protein